MAGKNKKSSWGSLKAALVVILIIAAFAFGFVLRGSIGNSEINHDGTPPEMITETTVWTCSMHPQIQQPKPGKCPICFMDLIPLEKDEITENKIELSEAALKLMELQTSPVERKFVTANIRLTGKIDYDETKVKHITSWVSGRIDRLYVDYTGIRVNQGDHMVYIYSPELISAQAELLQAKKAIDNIKPDSSELISRSVLATRDAAREKLRLLGLKIEQIQEIEATGKPLEHLTIYAPIGGVVIEKNATEGMYVDTGTKIYTIADLSQLWVRLEAYESDMMWIRYGQEVEFTTEAYPGEIFRGRISFIDPVLDSKTRTVKLRVNVENEQEKLKPEMFVRAVINPQVARNGKVMDEHMAGKWICPMHLDIVKDVPGICDICEMDLVTAESLGFANADETKDIPLVIPATAVLITGKRAVVYVKVLDAEKPTFEGREIILGPRAGDYYIVESGLEEGEIVVTNGNFKIDSEMQLRAKPSMMNAGETM